MTYTCVLSSSAPLGVVTVWGGSAFQCAPTNHISLAQRAGGTVQTFTPGSCGNLSAVTTNVTSTCYTSVLTIPAVQALNGTTVVCQDGISGAVVGSGTVNLRMAGGLGYIYYFNKMTFVEKVCSLQNAVSSLELLDLCVSSYVQMQSSVALL